jgi:hypothetical protein
MRERPRANRRGQTIILFTLGTLLVTLMVLITLGIATRAKERTEAQMVADAAAYSNAVMVARAFNQVAVLNRGSVAAMVAVAGNQALISWSGARYAVRSSCPSWDVARINAQWAAMDLAAADESRILAGYAGSMVAAGLNTLSNMNTLIKGQTLTAKIAAQTGLNLAAPPGGDWRSRQSLHDVTLGDNGANPNYTIGTAMGTMGWPWVVARGGSDRGSAGFGFNGRGNGPAAGLGRPRGMSGPDSQDYMSYRTINGVQAFAHEEPGGVACASKHGLTLTAAAWVMSDDLQDTTDEHVYAGSTEAPPGVADDRKGHSFPPCRMPYCPGIYPGMVTWPSQDTRGWGWAGDFAQPKLYSVLVRDYTTQKSDPWNLMFHWTALGMSKFDNGAHGGAMAAEESLGKQVVISAGMAYYHRPEDYTRRTPGSAFWEPPNFLNPFWRATLVSVSREPQSGAPWVSDNQSILDTLESSGLHAHEASIKTIQSTPGPGPGPDWYLP